MNSEKKMAKSQKPQLQLSLNNHDDSEPQQLLQPPQEPEFSFEPQDMFNMSSSNGSTTHYSESEVAAMKMEIADELRLQMRSQMAMALDDMERRYEQRLAQ